MGSNCDARPGSRAAAIAHIDERIAQSAIAGTGESQQASLPSPDPWVGNDSHSNQGDNETSNNETSDNETSNNKTHHTSHHGRAGLSSDPDAPGFRSARHTVHSGRAW
jgi:hypothetical protein